MSDRKRKSTPEGLLQRLVLDWLAAKHIFALRMNSGALINANGRPVTFGVQGMADILAFPRWHDSTSLRVVWLELKAPRGQQSELQKSFQEKVESEGHRYLLIRSLDELESQL